MYDVCRELCPYCHISSLPSTTYLLPKHHTAKHNSNSPPTPSVPLPPPPPPPPLPLPLPLPPPPQKLIFTGKASDDDSSKDEDVHVPDYEALAQNIRNWVSRRVRTAAMEVRHCRSNELSRGSDLGLKFSQTTSDRYVPSC
jgi:hypothetical protein